MRGLALALLAGCFGGDTYIVTGTVLEVRPDEVVLDHDAIEGFMEPMVMPFRRTGRAAAIDLVPGQRVVARLVVGDEGSALTNVRITAEQPPPRMDRGGVLEPGARPPMLRIESTGGPIVLGSAPTPPIALTFLYTRCPIPEACPALVLRLQALQEALRGTDAQLVALTMDPDHDTLEVLAAFGAEAGAEPPRWVFARASEGVLERLALAAGLAVIVEDGTIVHSQRLLVLDRAGRLVERYDTVDFPLDRVVDQLRGRK